MPELPEVTTIVRTLEPLIKNKTITSALTLHAGSVEGPHPLTSVVGGTVSALSRRGKLALIHLSGLEGKGGTDGTKGTGGTNGVDGLGVHLKMTGRLFVYEANTPPGPHTRVVLDFSDGTRFFFDDARKFGYMRVLSEESRKEWAFWQGLGPEPLEMTKSDFVNLFAQRNAGMKSMLLNQKIIAGVGNIYADESLFRAGIHPQSKGTSLSTAQLEELHEALVNVLEESIQECGASIRDYRTARGDAGAFQNAFRVYGRAGKACVACGQTLQGGVVAGRATVFCPHCQRDS